MILEFLKPFWLSIVKWGGIAFGFVLFYFKVRSDGGIAQERKEVMGTLKGVTTRDKIENDINSLSDDKLNKLYDNQVKRD
jgi:hypothetical protein